MLRLCLVGNPNCGKSSLFNALTNLNNRTGNWSGVTFESSGSNVKGLANPCELIDLPGIYSINCKKENEEKITADFLLNQHYDVLIHVLDIKNLERGLYFTVQLIELRRPMIVVLNKSDLISFEKAAIIAQKLQNIIHCPVFAVSAKHASSLRDFKVCLDSLHETPIKEINLLSLYPEVLQEELQAIRTACPDVCVSDYQVLEYLMDETKVIPELTEHSQESRVRIRSAYNHDPALALLDARYSVAKNIANSLNLSQDIQQETSASLSDKLDKILLSRAGGGIFFLSMYAVFSFTLYIGDFFSDFFTHLSELLFLVLPQKALLQCNLQNQILETFIAGIGAGIVAVSTFIPLIFTLYLCLSFLEESGYLARSAFVLNKTFTRFGLRGSALIPLIIGFGCNVPAIMSARTLEDRKSKIAVIMAVPFISCSARLSVFAILGTIFFKENASSIIFCFYIIGICIGAITLILINKLLPRSSSASFLMELPEYRLPTLRAVLKKASASSSAFIFGAGKLIVVVCFILHIANSFSIHGQFATNNPKESIMAYAGKAITPLFAPIGVQQENWQATVGLITGILAKEVVIGTLQSLYTEEVNHHPDTSLQDALLSPFSNFFAKLTNTAPDEMELDKNTGSRVTTAFGGQLAALSYLIFVLLYFPCISVFAAIRHEIGTRWAMFSALWSTTTAYLVSVVFYQSSSYFVNMSGISAMQCCFCFVLAMVLVTVALAGFLPHRER